jgi:hypothetical protein
MQLIDHMVQLHIIIPTMLFLSHCGNIQVMFKSQPSFRTLGVTNVAHISDDIVIMSWHMNEIFPAHADVKITFNKIAAKKIPFFMFPFNAPKLIYLILCQFFTILSEQFQLQVQQEDCHRDAVCRYVSCHKYFCWLYPGLFLIVLLP